MDRAADRRSFHRMGGTRGIRQRIDCSRTRMRQLLTTIAIENYRSLRDLCLPLGRLNVVTGANGTGKSSLYRALRLLADCASGRVIASIAREGGLESVLCA